MSPLEVHLAHPQRPLPEILPEWEAYFAGCREGRLLIEHCDACDHKQFYPRGQCTVCGGGVSQLECTGRGRIYSVTTVRMNRDPGFKGLTPYNLGVIDLEEGVKMSGPVFGDGPNIGDLVQARVGELASSGVWVPAWEVVPPGDAAR